MPERTNVLDFVRNLRREETDIVGLHYGDYVEIVHADLGADRAQATYVGYAGGPTAMVKLAGTDALVNVPRTWIRRPAR